MIQERLFRHTALIALTLTGGVMHAAAEDAGLQAVPFDSPRWQIEGPDSIVKTPLGRPSLELRGGSATLPDVLFSDGIIEFDIAFGEERTFGGVRWRMRDDENYEYFFDTVVLSLDAGEKELLFAVSEQFGGWGIRRVFQMTRGFAGSHDARAAGTAVDKLSGAP